MVACIAIKHSYFYFLMIICLHAVKWFQVLLFNIDITIQHYSFICAQSNGFKYCYVILIILLWHTVKWFQVFYTNSFICTQLNGSNYCYVIAIIQFRLTVKGIRVLLFNINNSIQDYSFVCTQLNGYKYCNVALTIQFNISHWFRIKFLNSPI